MWKEFVIDNRRKSIGNYYFFYTVGYVMPTLTSTYLKYSVADLRLEERVLLLTRREPFTISACRNKFHLGESFARMANANCLPRGHTYDVSKYSPRSQQTKSTILIEDAINQDGIAHLLNHYTVGYWPQPPYTTIDLLSSSWTFTPIPRGIHLFPCFHFRFSHYTQSVVVATGSYLVWLMPNGANERQ